MEGKVRWAGDEIEVLARWLVPGLLVLVAMVQVGLSLRTELTPWKGGGFGMFAVVDSPELRTVEILATTAGGEVVRLDAADFLASREWRSMRSMPMPGQLGRIGERVLSERIVPMGSRRDVALVQLGREGVGGDEGWWRPLYADDPVELEGVLVRSVELGWWKISYDGEGHRLLARRIGEPLRMGAGGGGGR